MEWNTWPTTQQGKKSAKKKNDSTSREELTFNVPPLMVIRFKFNGLGRSVLVLGRTLEWMVPRLLL